MIPLQNVSPIPQPDGRFPSTPTINLREITMIFGQTVALDNVSVSFVPGTRHAVVGENGAGKSTLMKVLFGLLRPDKGGVVVNGAERRFASPADAIAVGVGMVHQHFELIAPFTVAENVILGAETHTGIRLNRHKANAIVSRLAETSGLPIDPDARVADLSVAAQQRVEILKALYRQARVLILDEPTAVLAPSEARDLWAATARLSQAGTTVIFITHKLEEVMAHADEVTVLRRGRRVFGALIADTNPAQLAGEMVGHSPPRPINGEPEGTSLNAGASASAETFSGSPLMGRGGKSSPPEPQSPTPDALRISRLSVRGTRGQTVVDNVSLEARSGEILGIAGVDGSGQVELLEAIMGLRPVSGGGVTIAGREVTHLSVAERRKSGLAYVPEDRHHRAVVLSLPCEENAVLGRQRESGFVGPGGWLRRGAIRAFLKERAEAFDVRGAGVGVTVRSLSGGNQQKLVLARELSRQPSVLLASQPTRGLDFAASAFVHEALRRECDRGAAVVVQSLDLGEVLALSDRVAVMLAGSVVAVLDKADATEALVGALMTGAQASETDAAGARTSAGE